LLWSLCGADVAGCAAQNKACFLLGGTLNAAVLRLHRLAGFLNLYNTHLV
jgi:hypothetical protein